MTAILSKPAFIMADNHRHRISALLKKSSNRKFCPHCKKDVAVSTFKEHKNKFFNKASGQWTEKFPSHSQRDSGNYILLLHT